VALVGDRLYNRFDIATTAEQPDGNVVLQATDSFSNTPVQILRWTPPAELFAQCLERFMPFDGDPEFEIFSDERALYVAFSASSDIATALTRLREQQLFLGTWSGFDTPVAETPEPEAPEEPEEPAMPPPGPPPPGPPPPVPQRDHRVAIWIGAALVAVGLLFAGKLGIDAYNRAERERVRLEEQLEEQRIENQRKLDQAAADAKEAEDRAKKAAERLKQLEWEKLVASVQTLEPADPDAPLRITAGPLYGSFWASMSQSRVIGKQKVLVFPALDAAIRYLSNDGSEWRKGEMVVTSITSASADSGGSTERVLVLLSEYVSGRPQQTYDARETFPHEWISMRHSEGYRITTVSFVGASWWVVLSRPTDFREQVVLGPVAVWPGADIERYRRSGMFITEMTHHPKGGFVVVMSSMSSGRIRDQWVYHEWNQRAQDELDARRRQGLNFIQALNVEQGLYVVQSGIAEEAASVSGSKEFPRDDMMGFVSKGYRIAWLW
jgi:hypothetical protein